MWGIIVADSLIMHASLPSICPQVPPHMLRVFKRPTNSLSSNFLRNKHILLNTISLLHFEKKSMLWQGVLQGSSSQTISAIVCLWESSYRPTCIDWREGQKRRLSLACHYCKWPRGYLSWWKRLQKLTNELQANFNPNDLTFHPFVLLRYVRYGYLPQKTPCVSRRYLTQLQSNTTCIRN